MPTDKIRKYILPNIHYLFIGWVCLKLGTAYRLAAGAGFEMCIRDRVISSRPNRWLFWL